MPFHRASLYRFVKRGLNWSLLTQHIAKNAIDEINKNIQPRTGFFVLDDTIIERGSCELQARVFDHNAHHFLKGVLSLKLGSKMVYLLSRCAENSVISQQGKQIY